MPQTVSSTLLGTYQSIARAVSACNANTTTSLDVITVAHQLGVCPDKVYAILRSVTTNTSGSTPGLALRTWNASQAIFDFPAGNGAGVVVAGFDIVAELVYSMAR